MSKSRLEPTKHVHIGLGLETHKAFRTRLLDMGSTMQEALLEFVAAVAEGRPSAVNLVQHAIRERMKAELAKAGMKPLKGKKFQAPRLGDLDESVLYDMISDDDGADSEGDNEAA